MSWRETVVRLVLIVCALGGMKILSAFQMEFFGDSRIEAELSTLNVVVVLIIVHLWMKWLRS